MIRRVAPLVLAAGFAVATFAPAAAHRLNVFAFIDGGDVVVEAKFSTGKRPVSGDVRVLDGNEALLVTMELGNNGTVRFPLSSVHHVGGLVIEISTGEGHDDYWILTPEDIARQAEN